MKAENELLKWAVREITILRKQNNEKSLRLNMFDDMMLLFLDNKYIIDTRVQSSILYS